MRAAPPSAPTDSPRAARLDPLAVGSLVLSVAWPLLALPTAWLLPSALGIVGAPLVAATLYLVTAIGFGVAALVRQRSAEPRPRGRWLAVSGIAAASVQLAVAASFVYQCARSGSNCFTFTF
jgi:hypothetical protein